MRLFKGAGMFLYVFGIMVLSGLAVSVAYGADGTTTKGLNVWQIMTAVLAFITTGAGGIIIKNIRVIKELREAVQSCIEAPAAIAVFARTVPEALKSEKSFQEMIAKVDGATEEIADVLELLKKHKEAAWLRSIISSSMFSSDSRLKEILMQKSLVLRTANEVLEKLKR